VIDWISFILVAVVSIGASAAIVALFAAGLRLLAVDGRRAIIRSGAYACFAVAALGVLFGIYLIIPVFHAG
jgi:hypothetical protein